MHNIKASVPRRPIVELRRQLREIQLKPVLTRADYCNMDEILLELHKQKQKIIDPLEAFCVENPCDKECRIYDS